MDTIDAILWDVYDEKFIETIEGLTKNIQIELAFFSEEEIPDIKLVKIVTSSIHFENAMKQLKPPSVQQFLHPAANQPGNFLYKKLSKFYMIFLLKVKKLDLSNFDILSRGFSGNRTAGVSFTAVLRIMVS